MTLYYADHFVLPLPPGHRFPMAKYARLRERLGASGEFRPDDFRVPDAAGDREILRAHCLAYLARVHGGTHHAFRDRGEGFCVFNDAAIAARAMQAEAGIARVAVIDCDVHQGNGTAAILRGDDSVFTFSIHGAGNFPFDKEASDLDIDLPDGTGDEEYLRQLARGLDETLARSRPQLAIYLAGADPHEGDRLGRLRLTRDGLARRDEMVLGGLAARGVPVAIAMAGGYGRDLDDTVAIHATTILTARRLLG